MPDNSCITYTSYVLTHTTYERTRYILMATKMLFPFTYVLLQQPLFVFVFRANTQLKLHNFAQIYLYLTHNFTSIHWQLASTLKIITFTFKSCFVIRSQSSAERLQKSKKKKCRRKAEEEKKNVALDCVICVLCSTYTITNVINDTLIISF